MGQATVDLEAVRDHLQTTGVTYAVLFGSYASGNPTESSDVDICVRFPDDWTRHERFRQRNRIDAHLQRCAEAFVDVSDLQALPDEIALNALEKGTILYGDETVKATDQRRLKNRLEDSKASRLEEQRSFVDRLAEGDV
ncbi:nucleotidyltransferase domain-containing protein [Halobacteria archaeon AArc-curdl1]|uniref:Nucleotidyltransferase domain-containing protein n=1 Tax=Natronosalvus hydrolyticus TaxID=2979988 RepID=A0AAP2ZBP1_9EURY|nr:nucleotidyltransferase domain-containing protein [Halobacteria archaeon AArc-curdl1]